GGGRAVGHAPQRAPERFAEVRGAQQHRREHPLGREQQRAEGSEREQQDASGAAEGVRELRRQVRAEQAAATVRREPGGGGVPARPGEEQRDHRGEHDDAEELEDRTVDALAEEQREAPADAREERDPRREPEDERAAVGDQVTDQPAEVAQRTARDLVVESTQVERSEEHTSELQSRENLVCRLLLE